MGKFGDTKQDQILELTNSLIDTGQYKDKETEAKTLAEHIVNSIYEEQPKKGTSGANRGGEEQGGAKTMSSESDWQNIKVGEQFVLPNGQKGTKTGNELTDYTLG